MDTVFEAFRATAEAMPDKDFLVAPAQPGGTRQTFTFGAIAALVAQARAHYAAAGFGHGSRVAIMLPTSEDFVVHFLALNGLGGAVIPVNPDNKYHDLVYLLNHGEPDAVITEADRIAEITRVAAEIGSPLAVIDVRRFPDGLKAHRPLLPGTPGPASMCTILYTSGTTGQPKGCVLSNACHLTAGAWYRDMGGVLTMRHGEERFFNPTPFHHVNNLVVTLTCCALTANCLILVDRFSPSRWWADIRETRATVMHYVGIIPSLLMGLPEQADDLDHGIRFGFGAGIEPQLHRRFEERFRIPLVEIWGMTETPRVFGDNFEPRRIDTRAFGKPTSDYLAKVVDENGDEQPRGVPGELIVRSAGDDPRRGFFSGYLKDEAATEESWRGGWFHTGDIAVQSDDDMLTFVDRAKNIIRRAGENISAAEVEAVLVTHPQVSQVAVIAVADEHRDEEVMACVVPVTGASRDAAFADALIEWALDRASYHKVPAWYVFLDSLPVTPSQRLQRTRIFPAGVDPRGEAGVFDLRHRKKRQTVDDRSRTSA